MSEGSSQMMMPQRPVEKTIQNQEDKEMEIALQFCSKCGEPVPGNHYNHTCGELSKLLREYKSTDNSDNPGSLYSRLLDQIGGRQNLRYRDELHAYIQKLGEKEGVSFEGIDAPESLDIATLEKKSCPKRTREQKERDRLQSIADSGKSLNPFENKLSHKGLGRIEKEIDGALIAILETKSRISQNKDIILDNEANNEEDYGNEFREYKDLLQKAEEAMFELKDFQIRFRETYGQPD